MTDLFRTGIDAWDNYRSALAYQARLALTDTEDDCRELARAAELTAEPLPATTTVVFGVDTR